MSKIQQGFVMMTPMGKFIYQGMRKSFGGTESYLASVDNLNDATVFSASEAAAFNAGPVPAIIDMRDEVVMLTAVQAYVTRTVLVGKPVEENG